MKQKILFSLIFLSIVIVTNGQSYLGNPHDFNRSLINWVNQDKDRAMKAGIASRSLVIHENKKDGQLNSSRIKARYFYNEYGQIIREEYFSKNGKIDSRLEYDYNELHQVIAKRHYSGLSTLPSYSWKIAYHNDTLISSISSLSSKGKQYWGYHYFYNNNNQIIEQREYKKAKLKGRIEYDYYGDMTKKEVRYYTDSLKLKKTFRYDCGIGNSLLKEKQKDTLTQCTRKEELADSTFREIREIRDSKGRILRSVYDYNPKFHWTESRHYDAHNNLKYVIRREMQDDGKEKVTYTRFWRKNNKRTYVTRLSKDNFGFEIYEIEKKGKVRRSYSNAFTLFTKK
ncbi:MAG: hypothetical protein GC180_11230 [Bacteroidetes bacterium]|nr:hypothetical protein [Bacteroidota bacterium]